MLLFIRHLFQTVAGKFELRLKRRLSSDPNSPVIFFFVVKSETERL